MSESISGSGESFLAEMIRDRECQCSSASFSLHWRARYCAQRNPSAALSLDCVRDLVSMSLVETSANAQWKPEQVHSAYPGELALNQAKLSGMLYKVLPLPTSPPTNNPLKKKTKNALFFISNRFF